MNLKSLLTLGDRSHSAAGEQRPLALPPHRMMEQMLGDLRFGLPLFQGGAEPRMDIVEKDGHVELTAELPGLARDDVKLELADDTLVISGEKRQEKEATEGARKVTERSYGAFVRTLELPAGIKAEGPIHVDRLAKLTVGAFGLTRATEARKEALLATLPPSAVVDGYLWPEGLSPETWTGFRRQVSSTDRPLELALFDFLSTRLRRGRQVARRQSAASKSNARGGR